MRRILALILGGAIGLTAAACSKTAAAAAKTAGRDVEPAIRGRLAADPDPQAIQVSAGAGKNEAALSRAVVTEEQPTRAAGLRQIHHSRPRRRRQDRCQTQGDCPQRVYRGHGSRGPPAR